MPLVDYSSDSDDSASGADHPRAPPKKKPRTASPIRVADSGSGSVSESNPSLPPLPASFHDLYASTVRITTHDDPALHQGRTRQVPHVPGKWPSHIYIEWRPPAAAHALLTELVCSLQAQAKSINSSQGIDITSSLVSDLAVPLPLHISLSRPIALSTEEKGGFLREAERAIKGGGIPAFALGCSRVEWHRTESARSFLVLRVHGRKREGGHRPGEGGEGGDGADEPNPNPELTELLRRCNSVATRHGQPALYQGAEDAGGEVVGDAFHLSIAWSFAEPTDELVRVTERVFKHPDAREHIWEAQIPVEGVKVKIGNVVTHVALPQPGRRAHGKEGANLLGL